MERAQQELRKHFNAKSFPCRMRGRAKQNWRSCTEMKVSEYVAHSIWMWVMCALGWRIYKCFCHNTCMRYCSSSSHKWEQTIYTPSTHAII